MKAKTDTKTLFDIDQVLADGSMLLIDAESSPSLAALVAVSARELTSTMQQIAGFDQAKAISLEFVLREYLGAHVKAVMILGRDLTTSWPELEERAAKRVRELTDAAEQRTRLAVEGEVGLLCWPSLFTGLDESDLVSDEWNAPW